MKNIKEVGYEHYLVSEDGKVYNTLFRKKKRLDNPKLLKTQVNKKTGYNYLILCSNSFRKAFSIHRLVAKAFIPNPLNLPEVNHKNKNKNDNSVSNLEWVTKKQNIQHYFLNKKFNGGKLFNSIISNKKLLDKGINHYNKIGNANDLTKIWNCSIGPVRKVLHSLNIKLTRNVIPIYIKNELIEIYNNNNSLKAKDLNNHLIKKYNITLTRQCLNQIINKEKNSTKTALTVFALIFILKIIC